MKILTPIKFAFHEGPLHTPADVRAAACILGDINPACDVVRSFTLENDVTMRDALNRISVELENLLRGTQLKSSDFSVRADVQEGSDNRFWSRPQSKGRPYRLI